MEERIQEFKDRLKKAQDLREMGVNPYPNDFKPRDFTKDITEKYDAKSKEELEEIDDTVCIAGRVMAMRSFGKAAFIQIKDNKGRIQAYVKKDIIGEDFFNVFKKVDVGDIVGLEGNLFRTKTDELSIKATTFRLLTKGLNPLPEKFHGLKDVEQRYRQRYLDLIVTEKTKETFFQRTEIVRLIRDYFNGDDFVEVETPMMHHIPGGAAARPFITHHNTLDIDLYLRIAPELYLKRLVVGGFDRVFEINRNFRNEGVSTRHNPEFTMLEFYEAYATFEDSMDRVEEMTLSVVRALNNGKEEVTFNEKTLSFKAPWKRITVKQGILEYSNATEEIFEDKDRALKFAADELKLEIPRDYSFGKIILEIFEHTCEPKLMEPTFVTHYPIDVSPLSRRNEKDPEIADRFELIVMGNEIANGFSELNDPVDQKGRFEQQIEEREAGDSEAHLMDEDFVRALEYGMPPTAGCGIGIDRLTMLLTDSQSIRDVIFFPLLKKEEK